MEPEGYGVPRTAARMYFASIALRHLLAGLPLDHPIVEQYLELADEKVGAPNRLELHPGRWRKYLERDFSTGNHDDPIPVNAPPHQNRAKERGQVVVPYQHGKESVMTPWANDFFRGYFGPSLDQPYQASAREALLLDALQRGHGNYLIISALEAEGNPLDVAEIGSRFVSASRR